MKILPVIMAGGSGSRLWPLSRDLYPKQFIRLLKKNESLFQASINRLDGLDVSQPLVISNEEHRFLAAEQLRQLGKLAGNIILEPVGRNTAPAVALAALFAMESGDDPLLLVLAADHDIRDVEAFHRAVDAASKQAVAGKLVTFGINPVAPETGYGYICKGKSVSEGVFEVDRFVEKPDLVTAQQYLDSGMYCWNSGMFLFRASVYLGELEKYAPDILNACRKAIINKKIDMDFVRIESNEFMQCPDDSIDYAVMEKTDLAVMVSMNAGWNDVGSWSSLWDISEKDSFENSFCGDVLLSDVKESYIYSEDMLVAAVGISNIVVVQTKDAVLIADKNRVQDVKKLVEKLKKMDRKEYRHHREVYRPWGKYDSVDNGVRYQVKRITVKPGAKLSVQMHHHRAEHWIVVSGTAKVTVGEKTYLVAENESTFIPIGEIHALENPGKMDLELIEVQSGSYLGEDDIVRFEDKYGRV